MKEDSTSFSLGGRQCPTDPVDDFDDAVSYEVQIVEGDDDNTLDGGKTSAVQRAKWLAYTLPVILGLAAAITIFTVLQNQENALLQTKIKSYSNLIRNRAGIRSRDLFVGTKAMAETIASMTEIKNATWPFVEIPRFDLLSFPLLNSTSVSQVAYAPLVTMENQQQWEMFSYERGIIHGTSIARHIFRFSEHDQGDFVIQDGPGLSKGPGNYAPIWQQVPARQTPSVTNFDLLSHPFFRSIYEDMIDRGHPSVSRGIDLKWVEKSNKNASTSPLASFLFHPIYRSSITEPSTADDLVGFIIATIQWDLILSDILEDGAEQMVVLLESTCGGVTPFTLNGPTATCERSANILQKLDKHDMAEQFTFIHDAFYEAGRSCSYVMKIYPSPSFITASDTSKPEFFAIVIFVCLVLTAVAFSVFDWMVVRRHVAVMDKAERSHAIVTSLYPKNIRERILQDPGPQTLRGISDNGREADGSPTDLKSFLCDGRLTEQSKPSKPIADLFPNVTVMFADIAGFTAWSSVRQPTQVFTLLETLYSAFDDIAKKRGVFKVETVGDCYVAVAGLPEPREDHAVCMARFARDCLLKTRELTKELELTLGPDTADLAMRIGLHSGPVTAGVLRGDRPRFQLFGDTMNTTARVESTGMPNKIHISIDTATLLHEAKKFHWIKERDERVQAKGKGELTTYWLNDGDGPFSSTGGSRRSIHRDESQSMLTGHWEDSSSGTITVTPPEVEGKDTPRTTVPQNSTARLVEWNVDILLSCLREIVARREALDRAYPSRRPTNTDEILLHWETDALARERVPVVDEVKEIIRLPMADESIIQSQRRPDTVVLSDDVVTEVREYVTTVASMYRNNHFHSFEHASHMTMSTIKLLSRVIAPYQHDKKGNEPDEEITQQIHSGFTNDPLTRFACIYAALIHDVDHPGVPNSQIVREQQPLAIEYRNRSIAEQNSLHIGWQLLMEPRFEHFRRTIYSTTTGFERFRQVVVNAVMATDIMDRELKDIRNATWNKVFGETGSVDTDSVYRDRKTTIVIEHLIQASDVAHTMQHWYIYVKWNERLFREMYQAYQQGRSPADPSEFWYAGEIGFFDFYIIPLAKKLKTCGVFGVSSDEYLEYAIRNRRQWEVEGEELVAAYVEKLRQA